MCEGNGPNLTCFPVLCSVLDTRTFYGKTLYDFG